MLYEIGIFLFCVMALLFSIIALIKKNSLIGSSVGEKGDTGPAGIRGKNGEPGDKGNQGSSISKISFSNPLPNEMKVPVPLDCFNKNGILTQVMQSSDIDSTETYLCPKYVIITTSCTQSYPKDNLSQFVNSVKESVDVPVQLVISGDCHLKRYAKVNGENVIWNDWERY